jgi:uncharacterized protein (TIGR00251 family)
MLIKVKVKAGAKLEKIEKISDDSFAVSVRAKAEAGAANRRVLQILSDKFNGARVKIVSGHQKPSKILEVVEKI